MQNRYKSVHDLLARNVGSSSSFEDFELIGRVQMVFASNQTYEKGTLLLYDVNLDEYLPCRVDYFHPEYLNQDISIKKWSQVNSPECGINFVEFEFKHVYMLGSDIAVFSNAIATDIVRFDLVLSESIPFLAGQVKAISSVYQQLDNTYFLLELTTATVLFQGDDAIMYQSFFKINWYYSFTDTKVNDANDINFVEFQPSKSKVRIIKKSQYEKISMDNGETLTETIDKHTEGTITRVIDIEFGLYELDERYILCLYDYPQYSPTVFPLRIGIRLSLHHIHVLSLSIDKRHPFVELLWPGMTTDNHYILVACLKSHISILSFPNHWDFDDTTWGNQEDLYIECVSHRYKLPQVLYELALSSTLQKKFMTYPSNIPAINKEQHTEKLDLKSNFMQHSTYCSLVPVSSVFIPFYPTLKEIKESLLYPNLQSINENNTLAGGAGRFDSTLVSLQQACYGESIYFLGIIDVGVDGRLYVMDKSEKLKLVLPEKDKASITIGGLYEFFQVRLIREDLSYSNEKDQRYNLKSEYIICNGDDLVLRGGPLTNIIHYLNLPQPESSGDQQLIGFSKKSMDLPSKVFYVRAIEPVDMINNKYELSMEGRVFVSVYDVVDTSSTVDFDIETVNSVFVFSSLQRSLQHMTYLTVGGWYLITGLESAVEHNQYDISHEVVIVKIEQSTQDRSPTLFPIYKPNIQLGFPQNIILEHEEGKITRKVHSVSEAINKLRQGNPNSNLFLSVRGIIVTKAWAFANENRMMPKLDAKKLFLDLGVGNGKENRELFLKLRQEDGLDTIDIYMNIDKQFYPMGLIPGTKVIFHQLALRTSAQTVYSKTLGTCTYEIIYPGQESPDTSFVETGMNKAQSIRTFHDRQSKYDKAVAPISKILATITRLFFLELKWVCLNCNSVVQNDSCYGMCENSQRVFQTSCLAEVTDGTAHIIADIEGERLIFQFMGLSHTQAEWIKETAIQDALVYKQFDPFNTETPLNHIIKTCRQRSYWMFGKSYGRSIKMKTKEGSKNILRDLGLTTSRVYADDKAVLTCQYDDLKFKVVEIEQVDPSTAILDMLDSI